MGLVKQAMGEVLYPAIDNWMNRVEAKLPVSHVFPSSTCLAWFDSEVESVIDGAGRGFYFVGFVVAELAGAVFNEIRFFYELLAEGFGTRSIDAIINKGYEVLYQSGENVQQLLYTVAKIIMVNTGDETFTRLIEAQENRAFLENIEKGFFADVGKSGMDCTTKRPTLPGVNRERIIQNAMACQLLADQKVGMGSFLPVAEKDRHSLRVVRDNLSDEQKTNLTILATTASANTIPAARTAARDTTLLDCLKRALRVGTFTHVRIDPYTVWVLLDLADDSEGLSLLKKVKVFDVIGFNLSTQNENQRFFTALTALNTKLDVSRPTLDGLFFLSHPDIAIPDPQNSFAKRVFLYQNVSWNAELDDTQKIKLQEILVDSMQEGALPPLSFLRTPQSRKSYGVKALSRAYVARIAFCEVDNNEGARELFGEKILAKKIYKWSPGTNLSLLPFKGSWGLYFETAEEFSDFCTSCRYLLADQKLQITDFVFHYQQEADQVASILPNVALEKVHFHLDDELSALIPAFDALGLYSLRIKPGGGDDSIELLSDLARDDFNEAMRCLKDFEECRTSQYSNDAFKGLSIDEVTRLIGNPDQDTMPYPFRNGRDGFLEAFQLGNVVSRTQLANDLINLANEVGMNKTASAEWKKLRERTPERLKASLKELFKVWDEIKWESLSKPYVTVRSLYSHRYYTKKFQALQDMGNLSFDQVLVLLNGNKDFKNKIKKLFGLKDDEALGQVFSDWDYETLDTRKTERLVALHGEVEALRGTDKHADAELKLGSLEQQSTGLMRHFKLLFFQVRLFNERKAQASVRLFTPEALRAMKRFDVPITLPSNYILTENVIDAINETRPRKLFVGVTPENLSHNLRALQKIEVREDAPITVYLVPDTSEDYSFLSWQRVLEKDSQSTQYEIAEGASLKLAMEALLQAQGDAMKVKCLMSVPIKKHYQPMEAIPENSEADDTSSEGTRTRTGSMATEPEEKDGEALAAASVAVEDGEALAPVSVAPPSPQFIPRLKNALRSEPFNKRFSTRYSNYARKALRELGIKM